MRRDLVILEPAPPGWRPSNEQRIQVARAVACGLDVMDIAFMLRIEPLAVKREFADELRYGTSFTVAEVGNAMIESALRGDVNAQRAFLQMRGRWAAPTKQEADNDTLNEDVITRRKLMQSIMDLVRTGNVQDAELQQPAKVNGNGKAAAG